MNKGFLYFGNEIINCDDITRIYKCIRVNDKSAQCEYGIRVAMRCADDMRCMDDSYEYFGGDVHLRDDRFTTLRKILCNN